MGYSLLFFVVESVLFNFFNEIPLNAKHYLLMLVKLECLRLENTLSVLLHWRHVLSGSITGVFLTAYHIHAQTFVCNG